MIKRTGRSGKIKARTLLAVFIVILAAVWFAATRNGHPEHGKDASAAERVEAKTMVVAAALVPDNATASGTVRPLVEAAIAPKIMSGVSAVYVREGDRVRAGQVLIRLESRDLRALVGQAEAALAAAVSNSSRAGTAVGLQEAQTGTDIARAEAALAAAREQLSIVKEGPRKQQRAQARLATAQAEAQYRNAETELGRMTRLFEQDAVSRQRLDSARTAYEIAKAQYEAAREQESLTEEGSRAQEIQAAQQQVRQAEEALRMARAAAVQNKMSASAASAARSQVSQARAALELARTQLSYATITSPVSGVVARRMVDPGDTVSPGIPVIVVQSDSGYRLEATVPEKHVSALRIGKTVDVAIGSDGRRDQGRVAVISPAGDPSSRKFLVKVDLPDRLRPRAGEFGRMSFAVGYSKGTLVPEQALRDQGGLPVVFVVDGKGKARVRAVRTGRKTERGVEILSGLSPGDRVVLESAGVLADGVPVSFEER